MKLAGKVALVTGGSRGIGRAIALALAGEGADVAVNYEGNVAGAEEAVTEIRALGRRACAVQADVADRAAVAAMAARVEKGLGPVDILVNNAGRGANTDFRTAAPEVLEQLFAVHVQGAFLCTRAVIEGMITRRWGRVINISSVAAIRGVPANAEYCTVKAALIGFTMSLAAKFGRDGITANAIAPGVIRTDFHADKNDAFWQKVRNERVPVGREGQPDEIALAAVYLATNPYVNGEVVTVDGGLTMRIA